MRKWHLARQWNWKSELRALKQEFRPKRTRTIIALLLAPVFFFQLTWTTWSHHKSDYCPWLAGWTRRLKRGKIRAFLGKAELKLKGNNIVSSHSSAERCPQSGGGSWPAFICCMAQQGIKPDLEGKPGAKTRILGHVVTRSPLALLRSEHTVHHDFTSYCTDGDISKVE